MLKMVSNEKESIAIPALGYFSNCTIEGLGDAGIIFVINSGLFNVIKSFPVNGSIKLKKAFAWLLSNIFACKTESILMKFLDYDFIPVTISIVLDPNTNKILFLECAWVIANMGYDIHNEFSSQIIIRYPQYFSACIAILNKYRNHSSGNASDTTNKLISVCLRSLTYLIRFCAETDINILPVLSSMGIESILNDIVCYYFHFLQYVN